MKTKNKAISTIVVVTVALSILVAFSATASAADINVPADYTTIQEAIDAATSGDTINVADGTYDITSRISVNEENIRITGNVNHPANVVVQYNPVLNDLIFDMRASDVTVEGIKTTNGKSGFWFDQSGVTGCTVSHCIIDTVNEYGIYMKNGGSGHTIEHNTISNTGQTCTGAPAVLIENSLDVTVNENTLSSITDKGIYVRVCAASSAAERVEVTGNILSGCGYSCIQVYQSPYTIVDGNTISSTNDKGINIIGCNANSVAERVEVTNNVVSGCPWDGILVTHDRYTYIHGNTVGPTGDKGITIGNGENVNNADERIEVSGNTVTGTKYPGIQVAGTVPHTYIYDNTLTGCNYYGADGTGDWDYASIHVEANCDNTIVDKNDVSDGINGIQIWADNCEVTNNTIYNMGLTYNDTKVTTDGTYYNSGIIVGTNWLTNNLKPTGTTITCNSIYGNVYGLYVRDYASLSPSDNSVLSVTAENNWWGDASGPSGEGPGTGDAVSANVDYSPWWGANYVGDDHASAWTWHTDDSIQDAIDVASAGDTIIVAAGTYTNDIWNSTLGIPAGYRIDKSVTLLGAQAGNDPAGSTDRGSESILVRTNGLPYSITAPNVIIDGFMNGNSMPNSGGRFIIADNADDVTIKNCIIQNTPSGSAGHGVYIYPGADNALVEYNTFYNTAWEAIASTGASNAVITHNHISASGVHAIQWMGHSGNNNEISYNHISSIVGKNAIQYWGGPGATITHNVIDGSNTMFDGIWLDSAADGSTVSNNQIFDTIYAGINVRGGCTNAVITYNDISGCGTGVDVVGTVTGTVINFNEIYGNGMGVANYYTTDTVDAKYNWWGDVSGPYDPLDMDSLNQLNPSGIGDPVTEYVLYEPWIGQGGMVTGGGWIISPAGAYSVDTSLSGKATFGFVSMYKKGATVPTGNTQFIFQVADLNFHSDSYDWLVIAGAKAMYKGTGTINNAGNYGFMLSAIDGDINDGIDNDKFRIKIWNEVSEEIVYDNKPDDTGYDGTELGGGRIVIHKAK